MSDEVRQETGMMNVRRPRFLFIVDRSSFVVVFCLALSLPPLLPAQAPPAPPPAPRPPQAKVPSPPAGKPSDVEFVERLLATRRECQQALEALRAHYIAAGDLERA